ncbi:putative aminotransferase TAT2 [Acorus calamus]|uniref:Aminotransferase TAT2 n=1 Tax=Acorus calamus TaxID=4465 RepID=A0AAV9E2H0_ACOCL|nr:putative aminotransferase TAT2 [Acorus calamus]
MAPTTQVSVNDNGLQNGCSAKSGNHKSINNGGHYEVPCNPLLMQQKGSLRSVVTDLTSRPNPDKAVLGLALGDASSFPCFRSGRDALTKPVFDVVDSALFDGYPPSFGYPFARRAVAEYLGCGIKEGEVYLTSGATQAIQVILSALAGPGRNVLLPRPGFPVYASTCRLAGIEPRFYDLLPSNNWELNLSQIMSLADSNTVAIMVTNPNNPCGVVFPRSHLLQCICLSADYGGGWKIAPAGNRRRNIRAHDIRGSQVRSDGLFGFCRRLNTTGYHYRWVVQTLDGPWMAHGMACLL